MRIRVTLDVDYDDEYVSHGEGANVLVSMLNSEFRSAIGRGLLTPGGFVPVTDYSLSIDVAGFVMRKDNEQ